LFKNKGYTYVSVLIIFLLLSGTTFNLFFLITNFKEQSKVLQRNTEITNQCISLCREYVYKEDNYKSFYKGDVLYTIWKENNESLLKITVSAYKKSILRERVVNYKYIQVEAGSEES